jgi:hypothetical protein
LYYFCHPYKSGTPFALSCAELGKYNITEANLKTAMEHLSDREKEIQLTDINQMFADILNYNGGRSNTFLAALLEAGVVIKVAYPFTSTKILGYKFSYEGIKNAAEKVELVDDITDEEILDVKSLFNEFKESLQRNDGRYSNDWWEAVGMVTGVSGHKWYKEFVEIQSAKVKEPEKLPDSPQQAEKSLEEKTKMVEDMLPKPKEPEPESKDKKDKKSKKDKKDKKSKKK